MSQTQIEPPSQQSATNRAEEMMNRMAHGAGFFTALMRLRLQEAASAVRVKADQMNQPDQSATVRDKKSNDTSIVRIEKPATKKAEETVDAFGQRLSAFVTATSLRVQKTTARLREDTEDIWAEAQSVQHRNSRTSR